MKLILLYNILLLLTVTAISAQKCRYISGTLQDSSRNPISAVIVSATISGNQFYAISNSFGVFNLKVCALLDSTQKWTIPISISIIGFGKIDTVLEVFNERLALADITMFESAAELHNVIVTVKPVEKRGDTTAFNVGSFQNKLDDNLEDVLKKMPGFDIDENGAIKYNGKPIANILIEGDEMTKNYKSISQNITPDMISKVEMIDNWNKNPVLKGIRNSNGQVMNLTLKNPNRLNTFGKLKIGGGIEKKNSFTGNLFALNAKLKTLSIVNANNIGTNPYSEIDYTKDNAPNQEYEFDRTLLPNHIPENNLFGQSIFGASQKNDLLNQSRMAVLNNNYKPNKTTNILLFTDFYSDKISQIRNTRNNNILTPQLSYKQQTFEHYKPRNFTNNFQLITTKKKYRLLVSAVLENKLYADEAIILSFNDFNSVQSSGYIRKGVGCFFTQRLDSNRAFEISMQYIHDDKNQEYTIENAYYRLLDTIYNTNRQLQHTGNKLDYVKTEATFFNKTKKQRTAQFGISNTYFNSALLSTLSLKDSLQGMVSPFGYLNSNAVINNNLLLNYRSTVKVNKVSFLGDLGISYVYSRVSDHASKIVTSTRSAFFVPKYSLQFSITPKSLLSLYWAQNADYPTLEMQPNLPVLVAYRNINSNISLQNNLRKTVLNVTYTYTNLNKGASLQFAAIHYKTAQSQVRDIRFTKDFDYYTTRYKNIGQVFNNVYAKVDKYFFDAKTSISLKNNLSWASTPIEVNGVVASTNSFAYKSSIVIRPNVFINSNISMGINYQYNKDLSSGNTIYQWNPNFDMLTAFGKKLSVGIRTNYYRSNFDLVQKDYWLANGNLWYTIVAKKVDLKLSVVNLFNTRQYFTGIKNGYLDRSDATTILSRFALLELSVKF